MSGLIGQPSDAANATGSTLFSRLNFVVQSLAGSENASVSSTTIAHTAGAAPQFKASIGTPQLGAITDYGFVYATTANPTLSTGTVISFGSAMTTGTNVVAANVPSTLTVGTTYYVIAYAITSLGGTTYGAQGTWNTNSNITIGDLYGGGIVYYDKGTTSSNHGETAWRYLVAAPADLNSSTSMTWAYNTSTQSNAGLQTAYTGNYADIGWGEVNTNTIYAANSNSTSGTTAIYLAKNYNGGGYTDWFLPSEQELLTLFNNRSLSGLGTFQSGYYWASTEYNGAYAQVVHFNTGSTNSVIKTNNYYVRSLRAF